MWKVEISFNCVTDPEAGYQGMDKLEVLRFTKGQPRKSASRVYYAISKTFLQVFKLQSS